ncbi:MAG: NUDIX hydrolase [Candidatus Woesebacteria bacterium]
MNTPKNYTISLQFSRTMEVLNRGDRSLLILLDPEGKYVLGSKEVYPKDIYRLAGGGVDQGEDPQIAAARELKEELGIDRSPGEMEPKATITIAVTSPEKTQEFQIFLFETKLRTTEKIVPADDIQGVVHLSTDEMKTLIDRFSHLSDARDFSWSDYGKLYGRVHEIVLELA